MVDSYIVDNVDNFDSGGLDMEESGSVFKKI